MHVDGGAAVAGGLGLPSKEWREEREEESSGREKESKEGLPSGSS